MPQLDAAPLHVDTILSKISNQLDDHNHRFWSNKKLSPKRYLLPICIHLNLLCKPSGGYLRRQKQLDDIGISFLALKRGFNPSHLPLSNLRRSLKTIKQVGNKSCIWIIQITISHYMPPFGLQSIVFTRPTFYILLILHFSHTQMKIIFSSQCRDKWKIGMKSYPLHYA